MTAGAVGVDIARAAICEVKHVAVDADEQP